MFRPTTTLLVLALATSLSPLRAQEPVRLASLEAALAKNPVDAASLKDFCDLHFGRAMAGDRASVDKALEAALSLQQLEPSVAVHTCRVGSLLAMKGRDASLPLAKAAYVRQGLAAMAEAVAKAPGDLEVRLIRAHTCASLPPMFDQLQTARLDAQVAAQALAADPKAFPPQVAGQVQALQARLAGTAAPSMK
jgi:hypothetical protein